MVWRSPNTWTTGETISGSTDVANASTSLNFQLSGNMLTARNLWDNAIHLSLAGNVTIPHNAFTSIIWTVNDWQAGNSTLWTSARLRPAVPGLWEGIGSLEWTLEPAGRRAVGLQVNGATFYRCGAQAASINTGDGVNTPFGDILELTTADFVEVMAFQNTGIVTSLRGGSLDRTRFTWRLLGAAS